MENNKDIIIKLFKMRYELRGLSLSDFDNFYNNKLIGLIDVCDKLQLKGIDTISILKNLLRRDLANELITITGVYNILSKANVKIFINVINTKRTENYIKRIKQIKTND